MKKLKPITAISDARIDQAILEAHDIMAGRSVPARVRQYEGQILVRVIEKGRVVWELAGGHEVHVYKSATFGQRVKAVRKAIRQSQAGFAALLGISLGTLQGWEQDRRVPNETAKRLMEVSYRAPEVLIGNSDSIFA